jgi:hypothetical protein
MKRERWKCLEEAAAHIGEGDEGGARVTTQAVPPFIPRRYGFVAGWAKWAEPAT